MKLSSFAVSVVLAVVAYAQGDFSINTPSAPVVCQPLLIGWAGGTPPYILSVVDGANPNGPAILDLGTQTGTSLTWTVNTRPGSTGLRILDATGLSRSSAVFDVIAGPNDDCVGQSTSAASSGSASASGSSSAPGSSAASSSAASSSAAPTTSSAASSSSAPASSTRPASSSSAAPAASSAPAPNGAAAVSVNAGLFGLAGAAFVAILA